MGYKDNWRTSHEYRCELRSRSGNGLFTYLAVEVPDKTDAAGSSGLTRWLLVPQTPGDTLLIEAPHNQSGHALIHDRLVKAFPDFDVHMDTDVPQANVTRIYVI